MIGVAADDEDAEEKEGGEVGKQADYPTPWPNQAKVLLWRAMLKLSRNPADMLGRLLLSMFVALALGWVLTRRTGPSPPSCILLSPLTCCCTVQLVLLADRYEPRPAARRWSPSRRWHSVACGRTKRRQEAKGAMPLSPRGEGVAERGRSEVRHGMVSSGAWETRRVSSCRRYIFMAFCPML